MNVGRNYNGPKVLKLSKRVSEGLGFVIEVNSYEAQIKEK